MVLSFAVLCFLKRWNEMVWVFVGGPKLRKWYGAPDLISKEGIAAEDDDESSGTLSCKSCRFLFFRLFLFPQNNMLRNIYARKLASPVRKVLKHFLEESYRFVIDNGKCFRLIGLNQY